MSLDYSIDIWATEIVILFYIFQNKIWLLKFTAASLRPFPLLKISKKIYTAKLQFKHGKICKNRESLNKMHPSLKDPVKWCKMRTVVLFSVEFLFSVKGNAYF